jgi:UDP-N-acetylmuramate--alanine ligase
LRRGRSIAVHPTARRCRHPHAAGHDPAHLDGIDRVAITPAIRAVPATLSSTAALERGIPVSTWQELLGELMDAPARVGIGVTGTHGKSTTTRSLAPPRCGRARSDRRGWGAHPGLGASVRAGDGAPFVVEADEFGDNFLAYHPAGAIVTNVEMDHPDYFADAGRGHGQLRAVRPRHASDPAVGGRLLLIGSDDPARARSRRGSVTGMVAW